MYHQTAAPEGAPGGFRPLFRVALVAVLLAACRLPAWPQATAAPQPPQAAEPVKEMLADLRGAIAGKENQPAEMVFRNIEVFRGQPAVRVLRIMEMAFAGSLGVTCSHCHDPKAWDSDAKTPKQTARKMWIMMGKINQEVLPVKGTVNCYTCHRGQTKPALTAPAPPR